MLARLGAVMPAESAGALGAQTQPLSGRART
jgi:hypothetical protein